MWLSVLQNREKFNSDVVFEAKKIANLESEIEF